MSDRESIYGEFVRPGWRQVGVNEYVYEPDGVRLAVMLASHRRAYVNGVMYQSFMDAVRAVEAAHA